MPKSYPGRPFGVVSRVFIPIVLWRGEYQGWVGKIVLNWLPGFGLVVGRLIGGCDASGRSRETQPWVISAPGGANVSNWEGRPRSAVERIRCYTMNITANKCALVAIDLWEFISVSGYPEPKPYFLEWYGNFLSATVGFAERLRAAGGRVVWANSDYGNGSQALPSQHGLVFDTNLKENYRFYNGDLPAWPCPKFEDIPSGKHWNQHSDDPSNHNHMADYGVHTGRLHNDVMQACNLQDWIAFQSLDFPGALREDGRDTLFFAGMALDMCVWDKVFGIAHMCLEQRFNGVVLRDICSVSYLTNGEDVENCRMTCAQRRAEFYVRSKGIEVVSSGEVVFA